MDMNAREQYLETLRREYQRGNKKQKTRLLNEARKRTRLNRKVLIRKLAHPAPAKREKRRPVRRALYDADVVGVLVRLWVMFDCPVWAAPGRGATARSGSSAPERRSGMQSGNRRKAEADLTQNN